MMFVVCLRYRCTRQILHNPLYDLFTSNLLYPSGRYLFIISDIVSKLYMMERLACGSGNEQSLNLDDFKTKQVDNILTMNMFCPYKALWVIMVFKSWLIPNSVPSLVLFIFRPSLNPLNIANRYNII